MVKLAAVICIAVALEIAFNRLLLELSSIPQNSRGPFLTSRTTQVGLLIEDHPSDDGHNGSPNALRYKNIIRELDCTPHPFIHLSLNSLQLTLNRRHQQVQQQVLYSYYQASRRRIINQSLKMN